MYARVELPQSIRDAGEFTATDPLINPEYCKYVLCQVTEPRSEFHLLRSEKLYVFYLHNILHT